MNWWDYWSRIPQERPHERRIIFLLWHVRKPDSNEEELLIGVYGTEADAKSAIERLRSKAGFVDAPEGFRINRYELNRDHWEEGYDVVTDSK